MCNFLVLKHCILISVSLIVYFNEFQNVSDLKICFEQQMQNSSHRKCQTEMFLHKLKLKNSFLSIHLIQIFSFIRSFGSDELAFLTKKLPKTLDIPPLETGNYKPRLGKKNLQKFTLGKELLNPNLLFLMMKICEVCLCPSVPLDTYEMLAKWHLLGP